MNLPGSRQLGLGKRLFEKFEWQEFTPHPEWATYAKTDGALASTYGPYSTGIPAKVRIIYVPESRPVNVSRLEAEGKYRAQAFDPTNGESTDLGVVQPDKQSASVVKKPTSIQSDDWVIIIQRVE